jgi:tellurite resistance protein TerC
VRWFAVTRDLVVIWTANAFALLGLGSLLALVEILVRRFRYVDETIALVLAFVGTKIRAADLVHIGDLASLLIRRGAPGGRHRRLARRGPPRPAPRN